MPTSYEDVRGRLVAKWSNASKHGTADVLSLGALTHLAIRARLRGVADPGARRSARADAVKDLRVALTDAGCDRASELQRWVAVWAVGEVFGMEAARGLPLATLRAFIPLVRRGAKTETWAARSTVRQFAAELWSHAGAMKTREVAAAIRERVAGTRKPRTAKPVNVLTKIVAAIDALPESAQRQLLAALHKRFYPSPAAVATLSAQAAAQGQRTAQAPAPAAVPMVPRVAAQAAPAIDAAAVEKAGIFGSWGRKAG